MQYQIVSGGFGRVPEPGKFKEQYNKTYDSGSYLLELWSGPTETDLANASLRRAIRWQEEGKWLWESSNLQLRACNHDGEPHLNYDLKNQGSDSQGLGKPHRMDIKDLLKTLNKE